ncbi:uncharacterized protein C6orf136 homolog isoform X2 [Eucyclogobius newberryi]|uniref:uncharacterized protein C6orf136 homolog isoform X2 n=1 Tax=Eucyclogobius newberryi TaxID=166745 RepID=UPI003B5CC50F
MAVNRGGVAFWNARVRSLVRRPPVRSQHGFIVDGALSAQTQRPLSSASWALAPPNSLRYQNTKCLVLSHPVFPPHIPGQLQLAPAACHKDECVESLSMCLPDRLQALMEIPVFDHSKYKPSALSFPLTIVDGSGVDDIIVGKNNSNNTDTIVREYGCFRSLFQAEKCPAPFVSGSHFYCFHCPPVELPGKVEQACGPGNVPLLLPSTLCSPAEQLDDALPVGDSEEEQKLALMYERLQIELPNFFRKNHDYSMYSLDVEFVNGILNTKTRGRVLYQLSLTLWRLLSLSYYADAHLEVLKLTKHPEDSTVKARWKLHGLPFHSLLLRFYLKDKSQLFRSFDAFSTFYIGHDGLIHCHKVEKVMPARGPVLPRVTSLWAGALVALGLQQHRPALNLLPPLLSSQRHHRD